MLKYGQSVRINDIFKSNIITQVASSLERIKSETLRRSTLPSPKSIPLDQPNWVFIFFFGILHFCLLQVLENTIFL